MTFRLTQQHSQRPPTSHSHPPLLPACQNEQAAAKILGYTRFSWDDESGAVIPLVTFRSWARLTPRQKTSAELLGYTELSWDNLSGEEDQPDATLKYWDELSVCGDGSEDPALVLVGGIVDLAHSINPLC